MKECLHFSSKIVNTKQMKVNTPEIYDPTHLPNDLQQEIAKLAAVKQAGVDDVCRDDPIERGLVNALIFNTIGLNVFELKYNDSEADRQEENIEKRELTSEEAEKTLADFEARFRQNMYLHEGVKWSDVKEALQASTEALWSVAQMEAKGHDPDVYDDGDEYYEIGTCSKKSPESARNCIHDEAVKMAEAMKIKLMLPKQYKDILQEKGCFDEGTWSWLLTRSDVKSTDLAFVGSRYDEGADVIRCNVYAHNANGAFRGTLRVKKVTA